VKRWLAIAAVGLGLAALLYALFARPTHEERIGRALDRLARVVSSDSEQQNPILRAARLRKEFSEIFSRDVSVNIPELASPLRGRDELAAIGARTTTAYQSVDVEFSKLDIRVDANETRAEVRAVATLTGSRGALERDSRRVRFGFSHQAGEWLIDSVSVAASAQDEP
jgi:hypothetical protein